MALSLIDNEIDLAGYFPQNQRKSYFFSYCKTYHHPPYIYTGPYHSSWSQQYNAANMKGHTMSYKDLSKIAADKNKPGKTEEAITVNKPSTDNGKLKSKPSSK